MRRQVTKLTADLQRCKKEEEEREEYIQMVEEDVKRCMAENAMLKERLRGMEK